MGGTAIRVVPVLLLILGLAPGVGAAAPCSIPGTHATVQAALDDPTCDPINIGGGTFNENLIVSRSVTILGAGVGSTVLDGLGNTESVIELEDATPRNLSIRDLTITGGGTLNGGGMRLGNAPHEVDLTGVVLTGNSGGNGGGLFATDGVNVRMTGGAVRDNDSDASAGGIMFTLGGDLTLTDVIVDGNEAIESPGGIQFTGDVLTISGGSVSGSEAGMGGGGLYIASSTSASITGTVIRGNRAPSYGGLQVLDTPVTLDGVVIDGNMATDGNGGGGVIEGETTSIIDSAITNNSAVPGNTGGLELTGTSATASVQMVNSTISGNTAVDFAGGLFVNEVLFTGTNLTVTNNTADSDGSGGGNGGGMYFDVNTDGAHLRNTILSGNKDGSPGAEAPDCFPFATSDGSNMFGTLTGCDMPPQGSDKVGVDPMLGPLADNGGNTLTHALLPGSPAINAADPAFAPAGDQRGVARTAPDIGAYELVFCKKVPANDLGTEGNDVITGGGESNGVLGGGGNDTIKTGGGKDAVCAGAGKDKVNGGGGKDQLFGEAGKDSLKGGGGKDKLNGGGGKDTCNGGGGNDKGKACEKEKKI